MDIYHADNYTPRFIRCWEFKRTPTPLDRFTVVYTNTKKAGHPKGITYFRAMSGNPYHGYAEWGESKTMYFARSHGTQIPFSDLPIDCQAVVLDDYQALWINQ